MSVHRFSVESCPDLESVLLFLINGIFVKCLFYEHLLIRLFELIRHDNEMNIS